MRACVTDYQLTEAATLEEAFSALAQDSELRPIAGGTDLMVLFNAGMLPFRRLLSIRKLTELKEISVFADSIRIGAAVTYAAIQRHDCISREFPLLAQAARWTGSVANQNRGTLGGNIANGSPAADSPPALLAYDAEVEVASVRGGRLIPYREFHTGYKKMQLAAGELLIAIHLPRGMAHWHHYSRKVGARRAQAISKVCFNAVAEMDGGTIRHIRIAVGSVAPFPLRCRRVEQMLEGQLLTKFLIASAGFILYSDIKPIDDIRSTAVYRNTVSRNLLREFLEQLL